jgi:DNA-binding response OmpR family regulator
MAEKPMVLVVEDNEMMRKLLVAELEQDGRFRVEQAGTGDEGLKKATSSGCAVVILDMMLPDTDGLTFIEQLRVRRPDCPPVIAITGAPTAALPDAVIEGPYRGFVSAVFRKPFDHQKLRDTVAFVAGA